MAQIESFSVAFVAVQLCLYLNGQLLGEGDDYTVLSVNQVQFASAPMTGDKIVGVY